MRSYLEKITFLSFQKNIFVADLFLVNRYNVLFNMERFRMHSEQVTKSLTCIFQLRTIFSQVYSNKLKSAIRIIQFASFFFYSSVVNHILLLLLTLRSTFVFLIFCIFCQKKNVNCARQCYEQTYIVCVGMKNKNTNTT